MSWAKSNLGQNEPHSGSDFLLLTLVSFVRVAYETKKPRVSTRGRNSFSDKKLLSIY